MASRKQIAQALLARHGRTYAAEIGIRLERNTPSPLFRWLVASLLFSARIRADIAVEAARALAAAGWRTPQAMADAGWEARVKVLNRAGYARYDESTSRMLEAAATLLLEAYRGDMRRLRDAAGRDPAREQELLTGFKGIGSAGAGIFLREVQAVWPEAYPFADRKSLETAGRLGLPDDAGGLARLVPQGDFPRLVAALVRTGLAGDHDAVRRAA